MPQRGGYARWFAVRISCDFCGRLAESDDVPVSWSTAVERGHLRRYCEECSRAYVRSMEAKLDSDWW
ncbi:MAG: hypothetical protein L0H31_00875 [Nocardioidaceae bacterium]|nr:hypothetical protein [Nocardioidaceae bacterium]